MRKHFYLQGKVTGSYTCRFMQTLMILSFFLLPFMVNAQSDEPLMTMSSKQKSVQLKFASANNAGTLKVDLGDGALQEYPMTAQDTVWVTGPIVEGQTIKVYGDQNLITFFGTTSALTNIDLTRCTSLEKLIVQNNFLEELDLSGNPNLVSLDCSNNDIKQLDFSNNPNLAILYAQNNRNLANIDFSKTPNILAIVVYNCRSITNVDVSQNPKLLRLTVDGTSITSVDVTNNPELEILNTSYTKVRNIDVSHNAKLRELYVTQLKGSNYRLKTIDVSSNPELRNLFCSGNDLTELDLSHNPELVSLYATGNLLKDIDVTNNPKLYELQIYNNYMTFNTMPYPSEHEGINHYSYSPQNAYQLDSKEYVVNTSLDLTQQIYREGYELKVDLFLTDRNNPSFKKELELGKDFDVEKGKITFKTVLPDSIYCQVLHSDFTGLYWKTSKFMVKNPEDIGKSSLAFEFTTEKAVDEYITMTLAALELDSEVDIDFGDGQLQTFKLKNYIYGGSLRGQLKGKTVKVYAKPGVQLSAIHILGQKVKTIDLLSSYALTDVDLTNNLLEEIDFSHQFKLVKLALGRNQLKELVLSGKNTLSKLSVADNQLEKLLIDGCISITELDCSRNQLTELDLTLKPILTKVQAINNKLTNVKLSNESLKELWLSNNQLATLNCSDAPVLSKLGISGNRFKFSTLPITNAEIIATAQAPIDIAKKANLVDLASENVVGENQTEYVWKMEGTNSELYEGDDYTIENGITTFLVTNVDSVYCEMRNPINANMVLKTTCVKPTDAPQVLVASLNINEDVGKEFEIRMAAYEPGFLYADYGDGVLRECKIGTTYNVYKGVLGETKQIKFYAYDLKETPLSVFSFQNVRLGEYDLSNFNRLMCLNLSGAGLSEIDLTQFPEIEELSLYDNRFESINLSPLSKLRLFNMSGNRLTSLDLSNKLNLQNVYCARNQLTDAKFENCSLLKLVDLQTNKLTSLDFTTCPSLSQLTCNDNELSQLLLSEGYEFKNGSVRNNRLPFSNIPISTSKYFYYEPQKEINATVVEGKVDFSAENQVGGNQTTFVWKTESGIELAEGTDYTITDGVTTFLKPQDEKVYCEMTNATFPKLTLKTVPVEVGGSGIDGVQTNDLVYASNGVIYVNVSMDAVVTVYGVNGQVIRTLNVPEGSSEIRDLQPGIYMISVSKQGSYYVQKVIVE